MIDILSPLDVAPPYTLTEVAVARMPVWGRFIGRRKPRVPKKEKRKDRKKDDDITAALWWLNE